MHFISTGCFYDERNNVHRPVPKHYVEKLVQPLSEKHLLPLFCVHLGFQSLTVRTAGLHLRPQVSRPVAETVVWDSLVGAPGFLYLGKVQLQRLGNDGR